jgi:hypothetical protein
MVSPPHLPFTTANGYTVGWNRGRCENTLLDDAVFLMSKTFPFFNLKFLVLDGKFVQHDPQYFRSCQLLHVVRHTNRVFPPLIICTTVRVYMCPERRKKKRHRTEGCTVAPDQQWGCASTDTDANRSLSHQP